MKRLSLLIGLIIIGMAAGLCSVAAQNRSRIFGRVSDDSGQPIELANVRVTGQGVYTLTNLKGEYSLTCTSADTVTVIFSMIGYETRRRVLRNPADSIRLDVVMPVYGSNALGEAVVTGKGVQTGTMQKITLDQTRLAPSASGNAVEEIIATQAGVSTHNELSSQYNVRGGSFDENCVYLNGIEVFRPLLVRSGGQEGLSIINPDMVGSINFSTGGFEPRYGDKMSSVLDITYKRPERLEASAQASLLGAGGYVGWGNKKFSAMTSLRYKTTKHLLGSTDTEGEYSPNFLDWQAFLSWTPNRRWSVDILANIADNHYNFRPQERETAFGTLYEPRRFKVYFDGWERDRFSTLFGAATITRHFNPQTYLALRLSSFSTHERETYDIQGEYWLQEATSQQELGVGTYMEHARNRLKARVFDVGLTFRTRLTGHTLQAGFDWKRQRVEENSREWEMRDSMGYSLPTDPSRLCLVYSQRSLATLETNRLEFFAQDAWRFKTSAALFNLTYGLRLSHWDWNGETIISPRASLGIIPAGNDSWTFRAATGVYYQAPFYKELRDTVMQNGVAQIRLNSDIKSPRSIHFVLGADYTFRMMGRPFRFTTEAYYKSLSRLIPYAVDGVRVVYSGRNETSGYAAGIDFKLFGEFVPGADSWITFSIMGTKEKLAGEWVPRPTDQRYNLSLYFTDFFPGTDRWRVTLKAAFADGLPFGPAHEARQKWNFRAPAYKRVDIGMSYRLIKPDDSPYRSGIHRYIRNAWLGIDALNLMDIKNVSSYYWITDITNTRYAVPNYLTGRLFNVRLSVDF